MDWFMIVVPAVIVGFFVAYSYGLSHWSARGTRWEGRDLPRADEAQVGPPYDAKNAVREAIHQVLTRFPDR